MANAFTERRKATERDGVRVISQSSKDLSTYRLAGMGRTEQHVGHAERRQDRRLACVVWTDQTSTCREVYGEVSERPIVHKSKFAKQASPVHRSVVCCAM